MAMSVFEGKAGVNVAFLGITTLSLGWRIAIRLPGYPEVWPLSLRAVCSGDWCHAFDWFS